MQHVSFCVYKYILYFSQFNDILSVFNTPYKISAFDKIIFLNAGLKKLLNSCDIVLQFFGIAQHSVLDRLSLVQCS